VNTNSARCSKIRVQLIALGGALALNLAVCSPAEEEYTSARSREASLAYRASPFSQLSMDYFARFNRDPEAKPGRQEMRIGKDWQIVLSTDAQPLAELMAKHLQDFLNQRMALNVTVEHRAPAALAKPTKKTITLLESGIISTNTPPESFSIQAEPQRILVRGDSPAGLRSGVVKLVSLLGLRQAPILSLGRRTYTPRVPRRVGTIPWMGSYRDLVFQGYNGVVLSGAENRGSFRAIPDPAFSIYALSTSDAIPELKGLRKPDALARLNRYAEGARPYGLKTYLWLNLRPIFEADHPAFQAHPDIRGALMYDDTTWYEKRGKYILCTESPLVRQYLSETVSNLFQSVPGLAGIGVIIGGEEFHHCFMRPFEAEKGHTNCRRCEPLGHDRVVADLCNDLAAAARRVNPEAEVLAWPYSAVYVWSIGDPAQLGFIRNLKPGVALFTDIVKDDTLHKPDGVNKLLWDYSIDLPGPGKLAQQQLQACRAQGIAIHFKSEPELAFEASRLPGVPCLDRWVKRAEAMNAAGADGAWIFPWFIPQLGASTAEVFSHYWWQPAPDPEKFLERFAERIAGKNAGPHLRRAWRYASQAMDVSPELGPYFSGAYYLGPAHPMCVDSAAPIPDEFKAVGGSSMAIPPTGDVPVFARCYRRMADTLALADREADRAEGMATKPPSALFAAELSCLRWFFHTFRSTANYYESCLLRDRLIALAKETPRTPEHLAEAKKCYARWRQVLLDERENARASLPVMAADMRLDFYYGFGGGSMPGNAHGTAMIRKKLEILETEINQVLPSIALGAHPLLFSNQPAVLEIPVGQRQLFLDDFGIASTDQLTRTMHPPVKRGAVIRPDQPWETTLQTRSAPAWNPRLKIYQLWMITSTTIPEVGGTTYATSKDGLHWIKPVLGQYALNGSKENNFVTVDPKLGWPANAMENVLLDPDDPDPSRRYKALGHCYSREPLVSPDGIHWRRLAVPPIPSADESNLNYDPVTRTFIATVKATPGGRRVVNVSTSKDFEHWSEPVLTFRTDAEDQALAREVIEARSANPALSHPTYLNAAEYGADVYNMPIFRYESLYLGLPAIFYRTANRDGDGFHHIQLVCSRDLRDWQRLGNRQPFIGPSPVDSGAYDLTQILPPTRPILHGDELWFYYTGIKYRCGVPPGARDLGAICLAVLRRDGFVSLDAGEQPGIVVTKPFTLTGSRLFVNVEARHGRLIAEVLDTDGKVLAVSSSRRGNCLHTELKWRQGNLADLRGRTVRLRFTLANASFYSYWLED